MPRSRLIQPHTTAQIPRHTGLPPGQFHAHYQDNHPDGCTGNVYSLNRRAVSNHCHRDFKIDLQAFRWLGQRTNFQSGCYINDTLQYSLSRDFKFCLFD
jgi:hypothetical protein